MNKEQLTRRLNSVGRKVFVQYFDLFKVNGLFSELVMHSNPTTSPPSVGTKIAANTNQG